MGRKIVYSSHFLLPLLKFFFAIPQFIVDAMQIGYEQFERIYTQYYARFVIIARRYVRDLEVARDLLMDGFAAFGKIGIDWLPMSIFRPI